MKHHKDNPQRSPAKQRLISRRLFLKLTGTLGAVASMPTLLSNVLAAQIPAQSQIPRFPDWVAEARIGGMTLSGVTVDREQMKFDLDRAIKQGVNVIEADSRLSDFLSEKDFQLELKLLKARTQLIQARGLKAVWYIPSLEVITPNGRLRDDSFARRHPDWLQVSFDEERKGVFYGQKVFWVAPDDESAWLCPNTPYRAWFLDKVRQLAETGLDGLWLDVPIFDLIVVKWACACPYCKEKFEKQTGLSFPRRFDVSDERFWRFIQWRHQTITEFLNECNTVLQSVNSEAISIAEIVALDHMGATLHGSEGSALSELFVVWEVDAISETTSMAEASYDDWTVMHNIFKYCRGATMDRPSWVFCYGYEEADAQLVMASAIAAQNNPYELRTPEMTSTVGITFRETMFQWISAHSKPIFKSESIAPVAVIYSERNRDFLDALHSGGIFYAPSPPGRGRKWLGKKSESPQALEYMGDYRGLSLFLYQHQIPTDIYPFSRVDLALLKRYKVIVLPYMASLAESEKALLLEAVRQGTTLIVSGPKPGLWDENAKPRKKGLWFDLLGETDAKQFSLTLGKGRIHFWREHLGRTLVGNPDQTTSKALLELLGASGVQGWVEGHLPVIVQPYVYQKQILIHLLNYSWVGKLGNQGKRLALTLTLPWDKKESILSIKQSEPQWEKTLTLKHSLDATSQGGKLVIPLEIGINALLTIDLSG